MSRGGNLFALCQICGWKDYRMIEKTYAHVGPEYLQDAIAVMEGSA